VSITTKVVSSNPVHDEVYSIQYYVIKFVIYLRQVGGFLRFPPPIKLTRHDIAEILLKVALNTINQTKPTYYLLYLIDLLFVDKDHHVLVLPEHKLMYT
jgi:hypothetical protein